MTFPDESRYSKICLTILKHSRISTIEGATKKQSWPWAYIEPSHKCGIFKLRSRTILPSASQAGRRKTGGIKTVYHISTKVEHAASADNSSTILSPGGRNDDGLRYG